MAHFSPVRVSVIDCKMALFFTSLCILTFLQWDLSALPFKKRSEFSYPLNMGWACDLHWPTGCGGSHCSQFQAYDPRGPVCFVCMLTSSLALRTLSPPGAQASRLEDEAPTEESGVGTSQLPCSSPQTFDLAQLRSTMPNPDQWNFTANPQPRG